jgi:glutamate-5-semialdehyde dehydrogenase
MNDSVKAAELVMLCARSRDAARALAARERADKDRALDVIAGALDGTAPGPVPIRRILEENAADLSGARAAGAPDSVIDRLALDPERLASMAAAVRQIQSFDDPVGSIRAMTRRPNGILVGRMRIPIGVIAMIYESRPNVTVDAAALCIKSGNAILLRGGKEAARSNRALGELVRAALEQVGLPVDAVTALPPLSRDETRVLVGLTGHIDLVIPRGGEGLIRFVSEHARVPVIQHYKGVCHLYVDEGADLAQAAAIIDNAKLARPGVCNALECLLVHRSAAADLLGRLAPLVGADRLEIRGDEETCAILRGAKPARPEDFGCEFLAPVLAVRVVAGFDEALGHIAQYGSGHTEVICTSSHERAMRFVREVDASCVLVNASSRFNDGGELGLGAEIGISTSKLHAYGPMGIESLTAEKWVAFGQGQVR